MSVSVENINLFYFSWSFLLYFSGCGFAPWRYETWSWSVWFPVGNSDLCWHCWSLYNSLVPV